MTALVRRLAGAILASSEGRHFLVGLTKEPCDFEAAGFATPRAQPSAAPWYVELEVRDEARVVPRGPSLELSLAGEALARVVADRFVIERNGSVSERLWRLVLSGGEIDEEEAPPVHVDARWLGEIPSPLWKIVRDTVLRCL